MTKMSADNERL